MTSRKSIVWLAPFLCWLILLGGLSAPSQAQGQGVSNEDCATLADVRDIWNETSMNQEKIAEQMTQATNENNRLLRLIDETAWYEIFQTAALNDLLQEGLGSLQQRMDAYKELQQKLIDMMDTEAVDDLVFEDYVAYLPPECAYYVDDNPERRGPRRTPSDRQRGGTRGRGSRGDLSIGLIQIITPGGTVTVTGSTGGCVEPSCGQGGDGGGGD